LSEAQRAAIAEFELNLAVRSALVDAPAHLDAEGALGGPKHLAAQAFYITINDVLGGDIFAPGVL
jgi:hypothetical protein